MHLKMEKMVNFLLKNHLLQIFDFGKCFQKYYKKSNYPIKKIGIRHGEKMHETLLSS